jgi:mono/diheme cytochrome c family protein
VNLRRQLFVIFTIGLTCPYFLASAQSPDEFFEARVRPVLAKSCFSCHTSAPMGGLRLDSGESLLKGGDSGPAIVAGDPDKSLLIQVIRHSHERLKMPFGRDKLRNEEIADLAAWVKSGAAWPKATTPAAAATQSGAYVITAEQRAFWSFRPVQKPSLPQVKDSSWPRSPIDFFILSKLEERGLAPVRTADKRVLMRRAYFDLIGLPPSPEEVDAFVQDSSPEAFARLVDHLLASPRYGERWGRYWLDVARYSDDKLDPTGETPYENSFRYRDWVIKAFNDDMPYDLFVKAQIAGDLLGGEEPEKLIPGLGFFALSPQFQDDRVDATTRGFLGLTVACAQCHDHKYDPIPTRDYYSLLGIFKSTESHDFPLAPADVVADHDSRQKRVDAQEGAIKEFVQAQSSQLSEILAARTSRYLSAVSQVLGEPKMEVQAVADVEKLDKETLERWIEYVKKPEKEHPFLNKWIERLNGPDLAEREKLAGEFQALVLAVSAEKKAIDEKNTIALGGNKDRRSLTNANLKSLERDRYFLWRDLFSEKGILYYGDRKLDRFLSGEWKNHVDSLRAELARLKQALPPKYPYLHAIRDIEKPANMRVQLRGNPETLGDEAPRRFLAVLCADAPAPFTKGSGRLELAEAIADRRNPLTARVMVNRIWQHHFGQGIVRTPSNFGQLGDRPSHPELLDYLAYRFMEASWSIKAMHREIMLSTTYALSAEYSARNYSIEPENRLLWRANRRRLDAEALRDALLQVSGNLDLTGGGAAVKMTDQHKRRTVYGFVSRKKLDGMLALFDFANPNNTSESRIVTNVPLQKLFFMNSDFVALQAKGLVDRLNSPDGSDDTARINQAYRILFGRLPTKKELKLGLDFVRENKSAWWEYTQALMSSNEFVYLN